MDPQRRDALLLFFATECAVVAHSRPTLNLMDTRLLPVDETSARFAAMQKSAAVVLGVALGSSTLCFALFRPSLWFILGSVLAGVGIYWCWRATLANKFEMAAVAAIGAVSVALLAAVPESSRSLPVLLSSGMSLLGVGLYGSIVIGKAVNRNAKYEA